MKSQQIQFLRPEQVTAIIKEKPVAYWPLGLIEWHGPHLPFGVDAFNAEAVAVRAAEIGGGLVFPTTYLGTEREREPQLLDWLGFTDEEWIVGMDFPANPLPSMYAREEIFAITIRENLRLIAVYGVELIVIISGHAATNQLETLQRLVADFNQSQRTQAIVALPFVKSEEGIMEVGHASRIETSVMMALLPDAVKLENLPEKGSPLRNPDWGIIDYLTFAGQPTPERSIHEEDDPRRATAAAGEEMLQKATDQLLVQVAHALRSDNKN
ncbi:MAG: creatininase family protein [Candidatus Promineifilaceae bacterium]|nr:creatininase family protein [Candidatus Promineifilaceae bacterium]